MDLTLLGHKLSIRDMSLGHSLLRSIFLRELGGPFEERKALEAGDGNSNTAPTAEGIYKITTAK